MIVGFTGTSSLLTKEQHTRLHNLFCLLKVFELHHGDCIGADVAVHEMALSLNIPIIVHPPSNPKKRAFVKLGTLLPEEEYLKRNHNIVDACDMLIAAPHSNKEVLRSGTWATIRYARKKQMPIEIVWPDGTVSAQGYLFEKES